MITPARAAARAFIIDLDASRPSTVGLSLSTVLQAAGFEVQALPATVPPSREGSAALQREVERMAAACAPEDVLLVYVRGFCREQKGHKYLGAAPTDDAATLALGGLITATAQARGATLLAVDAEAVGTVAALTEADLQSAWAKKTGAADATNAVRQSTVLWSCRAKPANANGTSEERGLSFFLAQGLAQRAADAQGVVRARALTNFVVQSVFGATWIEQGEEHIPLAVFASPSAAESIIARGRPPGTSGLTALSPEVATAESATASDAAGTAVAAQSTLKPDSLVSKYGSAHDALQRACEAWLLDRPREARHWSELALAVATTPNSDVEKVRLQTGLARANLLAGLMARRLEENSGASSSGAALKYFRRALELAPSWWRASFEVGRALHQSGDFEGAAGMFKSALQLDTQRAQVWVEIGRLEHLGRKNLPDAQAAFERALKIAPQDAAALNGLANVLFDRRDFVGAARCFKAATDVEPQRAAWRLNLAWALLHSDRREEAKRQAQRALALAASDGESLSSTHPLWAKIGLQAPTPLVAASPWHPAASLKVREQQAARDVEEGEKQFVARQYRVSQLFAHSALALLDVAPQWILAASDNAGGEVSSQPAAARFDGTIAPTVARATALLGRLAATWHNDYATSRTLLARSLEVQREASVLIDLAALISATRSEAATAQSDGNASVSQAQKLLVEALKLAPDDARALSSLGEIAYRSFDYQAAQKYFEDALRHDARDVRALYGLGEIASNAGRYDEAEKYFARATEGAPQNAIFWNRRGIFASAIRKDVAGAEAHFRRALEADPTFAVAAANLAVLLMNARHDFAGAEPLLRRAIANAPREGLYHFHLGFCLLQLDRKDEAVAAVKRALDLGYNAPQPILARLGLKP